MDGPQDHQPEDEATDGPPMLTRAELEAVMDASNAEVAAGHTVPLEPVLAWMRATARRVRQKRLAKDKSTHSHE